MSFSSGSVARAVLLILLLLSAWHFVFQHDDDKVQNSFQKILKSNCSSTHKFINPDLDCQNTTEIYEKISSTEQLVANEVKSLEQSGALTRGSVFYRDLNTRRWFGINADEPFAPASLLKLPVAIAYYKISDVSPEVLTSKQKYLPAGISLEASQGTVKNPLMPGKEYTVNDLIEAMLVYSDNNALQMLASGIDTQILNNIYLDLGVYFPTSGGIEQNFLSVKTYAAILRMLYNASYLDTEDSEKLLSTLARAQFTDGIRAGVPSNVVVANKFGERTYIDKSGAPLTQLHDCGIIYHPERPYILCVMTEGTEKAGLARVLSRISQIVYQQQ